MRKNCKVYIMPEYRWNDLTEKQYTAMGIEMMKYPNKIYNDGIQVSYYGGESWNGSYRFVMQLDIHVINTDMFTVDRTDIETDDTLMKKVESVLDYMDTIANDLDKIIEDSRPEQV